MGPPPDPGTPVALAAYGRANPENVLSARVVFSVTDADSVRVRFQSGGVPLQATSFRPAKDGTDTIIVLGLRPNRVYQYEVEAVADGISRRSAQGSLKTADLPQALANVQMVRLSGATSRYALTGVNTGGAFAVAFDTSGAIAWYHDFSSVGLPVGNLIKQPNGNFTAFLGATSGFQQAAGYYVEFTPAGEEVATYQAPSGYYMDNHEILLTGGGVTKAAHVLTYSVRTLDLTPIQGPASAQTAGHQLVRMDDAGTVEFSWDAWDHIGIDEWVADAGQKQRTATDFDHPNAITFDTSGNYVVSWRNLNQITAIDRHTGDVLWRLGGEKGEYTFVGDPLDGFCKQHAVKILPNGNVLLFDNGTEHSPQQSRAVEYRLDHVAKTATMVWESRHNPVINALFLGWVERLENGNTWIGYTYVGRVVEVDPGGSVTWEGQLRNGSTDLSVYRIIPLTSLY